MRELIKMPLRAARATVVEMAAAVVERYPSAGSAFVRAGRELTKRSRLGGGLYWLAQEALMARLRRSGRRYRQVAVRTLTLQVDITDATGRYPFFYGTPYEQEVTDVVITSLRQGDVFLDVGANIGYFSTIAAKLVGESGQVIAFEPNEQARGELAALAAANRVASIIEIVPFAVAETEGERTFYTAAETTAYSTLDPQQSPMREVVAFRPATVVHATSLDVWLSERPELVPRVRCIKIDVEGAEASVLLGMSRTLALFGGTIVCETTIGSEADALLERSGFRRQRIERGTLAYGNFLYVRSSAQQV